MWENNKWVSKSGLWFLTSSCLGCMCPSDLGKMSAKEIIAQVLQESEFSSMTWNAETVKLVDCVRSESMSCIAN